MPTIGRCGVRTIQQNGSQAEMAPIRLADNIMPAPAQLKSSLPTEKDTAGRPTNRPTSMGLSLSRFHPLKVFGPGPSGPPPLETQ